MPLVFKHCESCGNPFFTARREKRCKPCKSRAELGAKQRREIRELYAAGSHTEAEWQEKLTEYKHCCYWCDRYLYSPKGRFLGTKDHLTPLSRGGSDSIGNIAPSCRPCNSRKGTRTAKEFEALISATSTDKASTFVAVLNQQFTFEPWPEPERRIAEMIAKLAASKQMEESVLPLLGIDVFAKKTAVRERRQLLRAQAQQIAQRQA